MTPCPRCRWVCAREGYARLFPVPTAPIVGDYGTSYLWSPSAPADSSRDPPKIVVSLRDPVERIYPTTSWLGSTALQGLGGGGGQGRPTQIRRGAAVTLCGAQLV